MRFFGTVVFGGMTGLGIMLWVFLNVAAMAQDELRDSMDSLFLFIVSPVPCLALGVCAILFLMSLVRAFRPVA